MQKKVFLNPSYFLKSNQNIKLQFDVFHGEGLLDKAISVLDSTEKDDFENLLLEIIRSIRKFVFLQIKKDNE